MPSPQSRCDSTSAPAPARNRGSEAYPDFFTKDVPQQQVGVLSQVHSEEAPLVTVISHPQSDSVHVYTSPSVSDMVTTPFVRSFIRRR